MTISITIPELNSTSTKDKIVSILSRKWPLTPNEIYKTLQREYSCEMSYQAAHKIITLLQEEGIITKNGKGLSLNKDWISKVRQFSNTLSEVYANNKMDPENFSGSIHLTFNSMIELGKFLINEYFLKFPNEKNKDCICFWKHHYPITGISETEHENLKKVFTDHMHYGFAKENTFLDRYFASYLTGMGKKNLTGVNFSTTIDTFVQGDFICQVYFESKYYQEFEKMCEETKAQKEVDLPKLFELCAKKTEINVLITKNASLADKLREEAEKVYKENKRRK
ncbi:MAG: hypothetical protein V1494_06010 [Candidatus Diapherotrites archaeon]